MNLRIANPYPQCNYLPFSTSLASLVLLVPSSGVDVRPCEGGGVASKGGAFSVSSFSQG